MIGTVQIFNKAFFGEGYGNIWFHTVDCVGSEDSVFECGEDFSVRRQHDEDVGINCSNITGKCLNTFMN